ncbi:restriction endonuclease [Desulfurispora thermophila]|uniref:restriction endonuclease n=1 Tax=Desulfurispora thermophila TaxID=265470 RepID=UPI00037CBD8C|nr:restriction endonuclease [Desulfurispora thermophila]
MVQIPKKIPTYDQMMNPLISALRELGGSGSIEEIYEKVIKIMNLPDDIVEIPHGDRPGAQTEVAYRLAWTRTYLKKYGILENSSRGIWSLSPAAKNIESVDPNEVVKKVREMTNQCKGTEDLPQEQDIDAALDIEKTEKKPDWREELLSVLVSMSPDAFERLVQRLLRESGFTHVEVTGRSGDGGIDGKGIVKINGFLSFYVMFQCKKYQGSVSASQVRDFRGAMLGRTDKGLLITTGSFTRDAIKEATRDGAPPIDLIDGNQLVEKLKELSLGVKTEIIQVESVEVDKEWFASI